MRHSLLFLLMVFAYLLSSGQSSNDLKEIDSIRKSINTTKSNDSTSLAKSYYRIGEIYRYSGISDSAYFHYHKAENLFRGLNDNLQLAKTLYGIAAIQTNEKDYTGAEVTSIEAVSKLESIDSSGEADQYRAFIYNNLGIVFNELGFHSESIKYYKQSIEIKKGLNGDFKRSIDNSINNLGKGYSNFGEYELALTAYNEILSNNNLINERPNFYALVLDNYAYTLYLSGKTEKLPDLFLEALKISDSVDYNGYNSIIINQHLAEYYNNKKNKDSAKFYAYKAKEISERYHNDDLLKSLKLLSEIEEGDKAANFLKDYVKLSDSLQKVERQTRNKFARIRFETDQIEQENIQIARERLWLLVISIVLIITSILIYVVITQRNKNKELQFIKEQQEANEEIYNLMLSQNESIEEARTLEKKRISEELHDGVLGRLFGTRLSLDSLNMNNSPDAVKTRGQYIDELKNIEQDIRKVSHELNTDFVSGAGYIDIIKTLVETQCLAYNIKYTLDYDDVINWDEVPNKKKIHIYRIIQESLHNIYKHANASTVNISFKLKNNVICLDLIDNGSGFDVNKAKSGIGLKNMNSRIDEINGKINIASEKDKGTHVNIEVPIP